MPSPERTASRGGGGEQSGVTEKSSSVMSASVRSKLTLNGEKPTVTNSLRKMPIRPLTWNRQIGLMSAAWPNSNSRNLPSLSGSFQANSMVRVTPPWMPTCEDDQR